MKAGRAPHVHARLACNGLGGVNGLGLKYRRCKEQVLVRHARDAPFGLEAVDGNRPLARLFGIPGTDLRDGRVRHLQRTHAVALGLDALGGGVKNCDDAREEEGTRNLMAATTELAEHLTRDGERDVPAVVFDPKPHGMNRGLPVKRLESDAVLLDRHLRVGLHHLNGRRLERVRGRTHEVARAHELRVEDLGSRADEHVRIPHAHEEPRLLEHGGNGPARVEDLFTDLLGVGVRRRNDNREPDSPVPRIHGGLGRELLDRTLHEVFGGPVRGHVDDPFGFRAQRRKPVGHTCFGNHQLCNAPYGRRREGRDREDGSGFKRSREADERLLHLGRDTRLRIDLDRKAESSGVFGLVALQREEAVGRGGLPGERR